MVDAGPEPMYEEKIEYPTPLGHVYFVHCEIFDVEHWNITQRCNNGACWRILRKIDRAIIILTN